MLSGDEEKITKSLLVKVLSLSDHLLGGEGGAEDGVVARKAAIGAVVHAFVGDIKGGKKANSLSEMAPSDLRRLPG